MHLKKGTGLPGGGGMVRVLPTEDDGNPMIDKRVARCAREAQISQTFLAQERNCEKVMNFESLVQKS
jgi:hypothetical protein